MTNVPEHLFAALRGVLLSERERAAMRVRLKQHIAEHPVRTSYSSRFSRALRAELQSISDFFNSGSVFGHPAFAALALVLCMGAGTSFAATFALPGEPLYAFKTRVNEPVQGALALSPVAKAEWSAKLTSRRLEEAELLAVTGKLTPITSAAIETGLAVAVADFDENVSKIRSEDDETSVLEIRSDFEASLNAHETVLASLTVDAPAEVAPIVSKVRSHAEEVSRKRYESEVLLIEERGSEMKEVAMMRKKNAETRIQEANVRGVTATNTPEYRSVAAISEEAAQEIKEGEKEAKNGKWGKAYGAFQSAARKMKESQTNAEVRSKLNKEMRRGKNTALIASTTVQVASSTLVASTTQSTSTEQKDSKQKDESKNRKQQESDTKGKSGD